MKDKFLCLLATFDKETSIKIKKIESILNAEGFTGKQTPNLPPHITLAYFDIKKENKIKQLINNICSTTESFELTFNHIGLFGLKVLFLAPDFNYELLDLHKKFEKDSNRSSKGWTAHSTILIDEPEVIQKALPIVAQHFAKFNAKIERLSLYEFFPTRFITECTLK